MSVHCGTDVSFTNEDHISIYKSCSWAELGFCKKCGSHLFYRSIESEEYIIQTGTFDSNDGFVFNQQIFIDEKLSFYTFANKTSDLTGAEVIANMSLKNSKHMVVFSDAYHGLTVHGASGNLASNK